MNKEKRKESSVQSERSEKKKSLTTTEGACMEDNSRETEKTETRKNKRVWAETA